jgi:hypothetical protein
VTLVILYPSSVRYVCKLDSWAHILSSLTGDSAAESYDEDVGSCW